MRTINLPIFGEAIPNAGGRFGAILRGTAEDGSQDYLLIVADAEIGELKDIAWSDEYTLIDGASSKTDGRDNTEAMATAGNTLALQIRNIVYEGHSDYYIPAAAELRALSATAPELFSTEDWYWSSTQTSRSTAWAQYFEHGDSYHISKYDTCLVRAVRQIPLSNFSL